MTYTVHPNSVTEMKYRRIAWEGRSAGMRDSLMIL